MGFARQRDIFEFDFGCCPVYAVATNTHRELNVTAARFETVFSARQARPAGEVNVVAINDDVPAPLNDWHRQNLRCRDF